MHPKAEQSNPIHAIAIRSRKQAYEEQPTTARFRRLGAFKGAWTRGKVRYDHSWRPVPFAQVEYHCFDRRGTQPPWKARGPIGERVATRARLEPPLCRVRVSGPLPKTGDRKRRPQPSGRYD